MLIAIYKDFGNDLAVVSGEPSWTLPMPGRFVIALDGLIAYAEVNLDYTRRRDPAHMMPALRQAASQTASQHAALRWGRDLEMLRADPVQPNQPDTATRADTRDLQH